MSRPLAERLRPNSLEKIYGQEHLLSSNSLLHHSIAHKKPLSIVFWGPPGCGKTTLARLYAQAFEGRFISLSAVLSGVQEVKKVIEEAKASPLFQTFLFVDEIHRFNKAQQDAFLPSLEQGSIIFLGATTENPSFSLNNALLSRVRVLTLKSLDDTALGKILERALEYFPKLHLDDDAKTFLVDSAQGDGRFLLNLLENISTCEPEETLSREALIPLLQRRSALYDKHGDQHYNLISALHKSIRGSDPDASLYWFCRMLEGGESPLYIARRLIRMASEDIGLADPQALQLTLNAQRAYEIMGSPEGELALAQAVVYLSLAPKSNTAYTAYENASKDAKKTTELSPPPHILNAPTKLMKELGYGKDYAYDHKTKHGFSGQNYFPEGMERRSFYTPKEIGFERELKKRFDYFKKLRENLNNAHQH